MWTEANEARQQYNLKVQQMYIDGFDAAIKEAKAKKIPMDPKNQDWIALWEGIKKDKGIPRIQVLTDAEIAERLKAM